MGNTQLTIPSKEVFEKYLIQFQELSERQNLYEKDKFIKSTQFTLKGESPIIFKTLMKPANLDLREHGYNFSYIITKLRANRQILPNILPFMKAINFEKPGEEFVTVVRQSCHTTLQDRLQTLPELSRLEKRWIATQILIGLNSLHNEALFHGDLKSSNILLTTSNHVFISDLATYKPLFVLEDALGEIRNFFNCTENACLLAPEKFISKGSALDDGFYNFSLSKMGKEQIEAMQRMDVFSFGCLLAEIFLENGKYLFTLEELQQYRKGEYSPEERIKQIENEKIRNLVTNLVLKDPAARMRMEEVFTFWFESAFPYNGFDTIFSIDAALLNYRFTSPDFRVGLFRRILPLLYKEFIGCDVPPFEHVENLPIPIQREDLLKELQTFLGEIKPSIYDRLKKGNPFITNQHLEKATNQQLEKALQATTERNLWVENAENNFSKDLEKAKEAFLKRKLVDQAPQSLDSIIQERSFDEIKGRFRKISESLVLIIQLLCYNFRNCVYSSSHMVAIEMLKNFAFFLDDSQKLILICPFLCTYFEDFQKKQSDPSLFSKAFNAFVDILLVMKNPFDSSNEKLFRLFIWENITKIGENPDPLYQRLFVENIHKLARICEYFFSLTVSLKTEAAGPDDLDFAKIKDFFESFMKNIMILERSDLPEIMLMNLSEVFSLEMFSSASGVSELGIHLLAFVNRNKRVFLKYTGSIVTAKNVIEKKKAFSPEFINNYVVELVQNCVETSDELLIHQSLSCLRRLNEKQVLSYLSKEKITKQIIPLLKYPNMWIRNEVTEFLKGLIEKDVLFENLVYIVPILKPYLKLDSELKDFFVLDKDILELQLPKMLEKEEFCRLKLMGDAKIQDDDPLLKLFYDKFVKPYKNVPQISRKLEEEEKSTFLAVLAEINKDLTPVNLGARINDFLIYLYANDFFKLFEIEKEREKTEQREKAELKAEDVRALARKFLESQLEATEDVSMGKFYEILLFNKRSIMNNLDHVSRKNFALGTIFRDLHNFLLLLNNFIFKLKQIEIKDSIDLGVNKESKDNMSLKNLVNLRNWRPAGVLISTLYDHTDVVTCLESIGNSKFFASGSSDGTVRVYNSQKIEEDFTSESIALIKVERNNVCKEKIKCLKSIEDSSSFLVGMGANTGSGSDKGLIDIYRVDLLDNKKKENPKSRVRRYEVNGDVKKIDTLRGEGDNQNSFIYVTHRGEIGISDIRSPSPGTKFDMGRERGIVTTMMVSEKNNYACIATVNGYLLQYDFRCNLISNTFLLCQKETASVEPNNVPIISLSPFTPYFCFPGLGESELIAISYGSDNHECAFFDLNKIPNSDSLLPDVFMLSSQEENPTYHIPKLLMRKTECFMNFRNKLSEYSKSLNEKEFERRSILQFLKDPVMQSQDGTKDMLLQNSKNCYSTISNYFNYKNSIKKMIFLPSNINKSLLFNNATKNLEHMFLTVGNDRNIRYWSLSNDLKLENNTKKIIRGIHVSNVDGLERVYTQQKFADIFVIHEFEKKNFNKQAFAERNLAGSVNEAILNQSMIKSEEVASHKDSINDMIFLEREKGGFIVTAGRDHVVKIWK